MASPPQMESKIEHDKDSKKGIVHLSDSGTDKGKGNGPPSEPATLAPCVLETTKTPKTKPALSTVFRWKNGKESQVKFHFRPSKLPPGRRFTSDYCQQLQLLSQDTFSLDLSHFPIYTEDIVVLAGYFVENNLPFPTVLDLRHTHVSTDLFDLPGNIKNMLNSIKFLLLDGTLAWSESVGVSSLSSLPDYEKKVIWASKAELSRIDEFQLPRGWTSNTCAAVHTDFWAWYCLYNDLLKTVRCHQCGYCGHNFLTSQRCSTFDGFLWGR